MTATPKERRAGSVRLVRRAGVTILAIDPGARAGWALSDPRGSGKIDHERVAQEAWWGEVRSQRGMRTAWTQRLDKTERLKRTLGSYQDWLERLVRYFHPDVIVLERQKPFRGRAGTHVLEFRGATLAAAARFDVALIECPPEGWRKHLNGREYDPAKDHHVAALCMLEWWAEQ